jgi:hypothetical protein
LPGSVLDVGSACVVGCVAQRAASIFEKTRGRVSRDFINQLSTVGLLHGMMKNRVEEERCLKEALALAEEGVRTSGLPFDSEIGAIASSLSLMYITRSNNVEAKQYVDMAKAYIAKSLGADTVTYASVLVNESQLWSAQGNHAMAVDCCQKGLSEKRVCSLPSYRAALRCDWCVPSDGHY